ncbi:MAG: flagellar protein FlgN [Armatimonadetes bacterium]|nr:flagellar protein FlgN [Armatimonadota bacterium]
MTEPFESVVGLLDEEIALHRKLLTLAGDEQRALVQGDAVELAAVIKRQEALVAEIRALEQARLSVLQLIAEREGLQMSQLTFTRLITLAGPEIALRFEEQRETLARVLRELAEVNKTNALLIRDHLMYLQTTVDLLAKAAGGTSLLVDQVT